MVLPQDGGIGEGQRYLPTGAGDAIGERTGARTEKRRNRGGRNTGGRGEDKHGESGAARRRSPVVEVLHRDYHVQHGSYTRADEGAGRCRSGVGAGGRGEVVPSPCGGFFFFLRDPRASNLICIVCLIFSTDSSEHFKTGLIFRQLFKSIPGLDKYFVITTLNAIALINATLKNLNNALTVSNAHCRWIKFYPYFERFVNMKPITNYCVPRTIFLISNGQTFRFIFFLTRLREGLRAHSRLHGFQGRRGRMRRRGRGSHPREDAPDLQGAQGRGIGEDVPANDCHSS
mmetsp:Transcript_20492/g.59402  ORF Transcript_20492/g.59402 Transcript_20492/m.59402 type:complete len:287 (+) Transcript_20492:1054-1914(+)